MAVNSLGDMLCNKHPARLSPGLSIHCRAVTVLADSCMTVSESGVMPPLLVVRFVYRLPCDSDAGE